MAVSVAGLFWVFGVDDGGDRPGASPRALIGVCYLPVAWSLRAGLIAALAGALALAASPNRASPPIPDNVWPIVASMFMFRMIIYLYELKHARKPETLVDTLSYFFLLPNYCFLHFPVVDYRTMQRGYFAPDVHATQRRGLADDVPGHVPPPALTAWSITSC